MAAYFLTDYAKNNMLNSGGITLADMALFASLHQSQPDNTGSNEITGGSPAYARKAVTWTTASGGIISIVTGQTFDIPNGDSVAWCGLWDAVSGGNFIGASVIDPAGPYISQGTYNLLALDVAL